MRFVVCGMHNQRPFASVAFSESVLATPPNYQTESNFLGALPSGRLLIYNHDGLVALA